MDDGSCCTTPNQGKTECCDKYNNGVAKDGTCCSALETEGCETETDEITECKKCKESSCLFYDGNYCFHDAHLSELGLGINEYCRIISGEQCCSNNPNEADQLGICCSGGSVEVVAFENTFSDTIRGCAGQAYCDAVYGKGVRKWVKQSFDANGGWLSLCVPVNYQLYYCDDDFLGVWEETGPAEDLCNG